MHELKAAEIVRELDKYIVGQDEAKKNVAIALRNRWRRMQVEGAIKDDIIPSNIIMIGPTGVGKTEIARRLAKLVNAPFIKIEATKFTEVGYVGKDVESIIRDLMNIAYNMVEKEMGAAIEETAMEKVEESLLDYVLPGSDKTEPETRAKFRDMLKRGVLDDREIEIEIMENSAPKIDIFGMGGMEAFEGLQDMISNMSPKKKRHKKARVKDARKILLEMEIQNRIDRDAVIEKAKHRVENDSIVFLDEIDKIIATGNHEGVDVSRSGVQRDLLPIVEGTNVMTKYGVVKTDYILFIAAGAFSHVKISDLMPELQGRFPVRVELSSLGIDDFRRILVEPDNAIIKQYMVLLNTEDINVAFSDDAVNEIAKSAFNANQKIEDIGARRLRTIITKVLEEIMYNAPDIEEKKIVINEAFVKERIGPVFEDSDMRKYIL